MPKATVAATAARAGGEEIRVHLRNTGAVAAVAGKQTLLHADGTQALPAYYSDNYLSLLPDEEVVVTISLPTADHSEGMRLEMRGWRCAAGT